MSQNAITIPFPKPAVEEKPRWEKNLYKKSLGPSLDQKQEGETGTHDGKPLIGVRNRAHRCHANNGGGLQK